jgi:hypothetical protein
MYLYMYVCDVSTRCNLSRKIMIITHYLQCLHAMQSIQSQAQQNNHLILRTNPKNTLNPRNQLPSHRIPPLPRPLNRIPILLRSSQ